MDAISPAITVAPSSPASTPVSGLPSSSSNASRPPTSYQWLSGDSSDPSISISSKSITTLPPNDEVALTGDVTISGTNTVWASLCATMRSRSLI